MLSARQRFIRWIALSTFRTTRVAPGSRQLTFILMRIFIVYEQIQCERDCVRDLREAMPRAASIAGVGRRLHITLLRLQLLSCVVFFFVLFPPGLLNKREIARSQGTDKYNQASSNNHFSGTIRISCPDHTTIDTLYSQ